jgi:uncharacterized membrane protein YoaK (UPF0700 family)
VLQACLLAIIAGYADTVGFIRYEAFAGLMTGNTILLGIEVASAKWRLALFHGAIIGVFLTGVIISRVFMRLGLRAWVALTAAALLLVLCGFLDKAAGAMTLALAMGMQNSAANRFNGVALNTVFITGNLQKLGEGLLHWLWPTRDPKIKSDGVRIFLFVWLGYAAGAGLGALAHNWLSYPLLLAAVLLPFVMMSDDDSRALRQWRNRLLSKVGPA